MWNLPPPPSFQGLHPDKPVTVYQRHLPHWRQPGATYFVTFRLADSLPQAKLASLRADRERWRKSHPPPRSDATARAFQVLFSERIEQYLAAGYGACWLRRSAVMDVMA